MPHITRGSEYLLIVLFAGLSLQSLADTQRKLKILLFQIHFKFFLNPCGAL